MLRALIAAITFTCTLSNISFAEEITNESNNKQEVEVKTNSSLQYKAEAIISNEERIHKVSNGETLSGIAVRFRTSVKKINCNLERQARWSKRRIKLNLPWNQ